MGNSPQNEAEVNQLDKISEKAYNSHQEPVRQTQSPKSKLLCEERSNVEELHGISKQTLSISIQNLTKIITEGTTIVSGKEGQKYLVHLIHFDSEEQYNLYTDTLVYRVKMLALCHKAKKYFNHLLAIYADKNYICTGCHPCTLYRLYLIEEYYSPNLAQFFQNHHFSYFDIFDLLSSFVKVMSAYQYKRLRFGQINFSNVFVCIYDHPKTSSRVVQASHLNNDCFKQTEKRQQKYYCKVRDPYIKQYKTNKKNESGSKKQPQIDVYKEDVLKVGEALAEILREKTSRVSDEEATSKSTYSECEQLKVKNFIEKLVNNYMICPINSRYNWLQIQRLFQQLHNNEKQVPASMIQSIKTQHQYKPTFSSQADLRTRSVDKAINKPLICRIPESLKTLPGKNPSLFNTFQNKENVSGNMNSFITLKPYKKSESKPNISILPPPNTQPNSDRSPKNIFPSHQNTFPSLLPGSCFNTINQPAVGSNIMQTQKNSGYGIVENLHPEKTGDKIKYENLYNIGKCWIKFEGNFYQGSKEGPGTIYLSNGHIFTGVFEKDLANGKGSVFVNGDLVLKGTWKNNILVTEF